MGYSLCPSQQLLCTLITGVSPEAKDQKKFLLARYINRNHITPLSAESLDGLATHNDPKRVYNP